MVILSCYAYSNKRGSEYRAGRETVESLSKVGVDQVVFIGLSGNNMGDFDELWGDISLADSNIRIIPIRAGILAEWINLFNVYRIFPPIFYLAFPFWHLSVLKYSKRICKLFEITAVHQLNPVGFREPGFLWLLKDLKFVWGPIGGVKTVGKIQMKQLSGKDWFYYKFKNVVTNFQFKLSFRVRQAAKRADSIIFATLDTHEIFKNWYCRTGIILPEQGFGALPITDNHSAMEKMDIVLWIGDDSLRKNFSLFEDIARNFLLEEKHDVKFVAIGTKMKSKYILSLGRLPNEKVKYWLSESKVLVITSFNEGNPAVLFEAISNYCKLVSFDHSGMQLLGREIGAALIDENLEYRQIVIQFCRNLKIALEDEADQSLYNGVIAKYSWYEKARKIKKLYNI
jgi:hypothetical protein